MQVVTWGSESKGGDSNAVRGELQNVTYASSEMILKALPPSNLVER
jgi:hypothetical protein